MKALRRPACLLLALLAFAATVTAFAHAADSDWAQSTTPPDSKLVEGSPAALVRACGKPDASLMRVAAVLAQRKKSGLSYLEGDGLTELLRRGGEPHVWPRAWIASGKELDDAKVSPRLAKFGESVAEEGERRCGVARLRLDDDTTIISAVAVDSVADLEAPLPVRGRTGQWLELRAIVKIPATSARVVVTGPRGAPRAVSTSWDGTHARARFALSEPGSFVVQVVADTQRGPRPVLEARVFADVPPESEFLSASAPGEEAGKNLAGKDALYAMVDALRAAESLTTLKRDSRLESLAAAHAAHMETAHTVGHDVGDGDPYARAEKAGLSVESVGENVANAESLVAAHRTLYRSPSHRANLVRVQYTHMGFAVRKGKTGFWVAQVFAKIN